MASFNDPSAVEALEQEGKTGLQVMASFHDLLKDSPDRWIAYVLGSVIGYAEMAFFLAVPGQRSENRFGQDPLVSGRGFAD
jgi:hypothetical protein